MGGFEDFFEDLFYKNFETFSSGIQKDLSALSMNELSRDRSFSRDLSLFRLAVPAFTQCPTSNFGPAQSTNYYLTPSNIVYNSIQLV